MGRAIKTLIALAILLALGSCVSFYVSSQQETEEFPLWSGVPKEMTLWDWFGIVLLVFAGAIAFAALRLYSQDIEEKEDGRTF